VPQVSIWDPTRNLVRKIATAVTAIAGRPVKQNEVIHAALLAYAKDVAKMDDAAIAAALAAPEARRRA